MRETLVSGLLPLAAHGTDEQREEYLPRIASGELLVAPALNEPGSALPECSGHPLRRRARHRTKARACRCTTTLPGRETVLLVSVSGDDGPAVVLVDPAADGVTPHRHPGLARIR